MAEEVKYVVLELSIFDLVEDFVWVVSSHQQEATAKGQVAQLREEAGDSLLGIGDWYSGVEFETLTIEEFREEYPEEYSDWIKTH